MTRILNHTAAICFLVLALTAGAAQAVDVTGGQPGGGGLQEEADEPEDVNGDEPTVLQCGEESEPFDIPVGPHSAIAGGHDEKSFALAAQELYDEIGLGRPSCDSSNCGFGQNCPALGGSQTTSGGVSADWRAPGSRFVDLDIKPGTQGQQTCANCS
ncbi:hypothetical protein Poly30_50120 [Planctomycetes bacterium Poly30]|uniref:Uncharacterized protein n=1 Tax=Saltatorellus ferox TaxID=2528018 RepID=A0A518EZF3_9BACT|nr:hypothetical protein Poly30_50120 [Planctomycetes bacterium Poly30]